MCCSKGKRLREEGRKKAAIRKLFGCANPCMDDDTMRDVPTKKKKSDLKEEATQYVTTLGNQSPRKEAMKEVSKERVLPPAQITKEVKESIDFWSSRLDFMSFQDQTALSQVEEVSTDAANASFVMIQSRHEIETRLESVAPRQCHIDDLRAATSQVDHLVTHASPFLTTRRLLNKSIEENQNCPNQKLIARRNDIYSALSPVKQDLPSDDMRLPESLSEPYALCHKPSIHPYFLQSRRTFPSI